MGILNLINYQCLFLANCMAELKVYNQSVVFTAPVGNCANHKLRLFFLKIRTRSFGSCKYL